MESILRVDLNEIINANRSTSSATIVYGIFANILARLWRFLAFLSKVINFVLIGLVFIVLCFILIVIIRLSFRNLNMDNHSTEEV